MATTNARLLKDVVLQLTNRERNHWKQEVLSFKSIHALNVYVHTLVMNSAECSLQFLINDFCMWMLTLLLMHLLLTLNHVRTISFREAKSTEDKFQLKVWHLLPGISYKSSWTKRLERNWEREKSKPLSSCTPCNRQTAAGTCSCLGWSPNLEIHQKINQGSTIRAWNH
jgi:uncharacterized DUF497 family protein